MGFLDVGVFQVWLLRLFNWINSWSPIFILAPYERAIGNCSEEIYFGFLYARRHKKKIVLLRPFSIFGLPDICNRELFELRSPESLIWGEPVFRLAGNLLLTICFGQFPVTIQFLTINFRRSARYLFGALRYHLAGGEGPKPVFRRQQRWHLYEPSQIGTDYIWNPGRLERFSWENSDSVNWGADFDSVLPVRFSARKTRMAEATLREMGISESDWFVCLHVREGGFKGDAWSPRNSDVMACLPAIQTIVAMGGKVVRLGDSKMKRLPAVAGLIDYPFTAHKSELMDLYLIQRCRLYMGTNSGLMDVAHLFQKQEVYINVTDWITPAQRSDALIIPKHIFSKKLNRYLSVQECLNEVASGSYDFSHSDDRFSFKDNTAEEIQAVLLEALSRTASERPSPLQEQYVQLRRQYIHRWVEQVRAGVDMTDNEALGRYRSEKLVRDLRYRVSSRSTYCRGTLGREFLRQNWTTSSMERGA